MYSKSFAITAFFVFTLSSVSMFDIAHAITPSSVKIGAKTYYKVLSTDATLNTGNKVCAAVGKSCIGYTNHGSNAVCTAFHPTAKNVKSVNGSKAGFYCNGAPQKGLACEKMKDTCQVCPTCNVNADCGTDISQQFREMYVECGATLPKSSSPKSSSTSSSTKNPAPQGSVGPYPGKLACDFYQTAMKKVTNCKAVGVANNFCVIAMQSRLAKAVECKENGRIVCTIPCPTKGAATLQQCAYDPERRSGYQRPPYNFCSTVSKQFSISSSSAKKKSGETCKHGGECATGICIGTGRPNNQDYYQCSCNSLKLDVSCNR